jgi:hypothetical protein
MSKFSLILTVVLIAVVGCTSAPIPSASEPTPETEPEEVINLAIDAWNAGDIDALKALFAHDAVAHFPDWGDTESGAEEIAAWIEGLAAANFVIEPESIETEGDTVTVAAKVWADATRELGIAPLVTIDVYTVRDGKIASQTSTLTEESVAKLMAAMAPQPSAVVTAYVEAINAGDLETAMALCHEEVYADVAPMLLPGFPDPSGGTGEDARARLEDAVALKVEIETEILSVAGDTVTARSQVCSDYLRTLNAAPLVANDVIEVRDGQVRSWNRTIAKSSLEKLEEGLARSGMPAAATPRTGEVLVSAPGDLLGSWTYHVLGEPAVLQFNRDGRFFIRDPEGKYGDRAQFRFVGGLLLIETQNPAIRDYCENGIGSYVVFVIRAGGKPVGLRFHEIHDLCESRSSILTEEVLTPESEG